MNGPRGKLVQLDEGKREEARGRKVNEGRWKETRSGGGDTGMELSCGRREAAEGNVGVWEKEEKERDRVSVS